MGVNGGLWKSWTIGVHKSAVDYPSWCRIRKIDLGKWFYGHVGEGLGIIWIFVSFFRFIVSNTSHQYVWSSEYPWCRWYGISTRWTIICTQISILQQRYTNWQRVKRVLGRHVDVLHIFYNMRPGLVHLMFCAIKLSAKTMQIINILLQLHTCVCFFQHLLR